MTNYERKREAPYESYGASIVPCKEDLVYDCPGCDERFAVQYDGNGSEITRFNCPNCDEYISLRIPGVNA